MQRTLPGRRLALTDPGLPVAPELAGFTAASATCIYGTDDRDTICPKLPAEQMTTVPLKGDHHFGGSNADAVDSANTIDYSSPRFQHAGEADAVGASQCRVRR